MFFIGILRFVLMLIMLTTGLLIVLCSALVPLRIAGVRITNYVVQAMSRCALWIFGLKLSCSDLATFKAHHGLIIANHLSYFDIIVLMALAPTRFLSNHAVRSMPIIGWIAQAIDTVFVDRGSKESRAEARAMIGKKLARNPYPPLTIFPEGGINNEDANVLLPFQLGAFRIAQSGQVSILPCLFQYQPLEKIRWWSHTESMYKAAWRLATYRGYKTVLLEVLPAFVIQATDEVEMLAQQVRLEMNMAIEIK